ncbi:MAG: ribonuclease P protein component [Candidatus Nealsonbacteria bacterium]
MTLQNNRLQKRKDIDLVFKKGKTLKEGLLLLKVLETDLNVSRFAFIISQKVSKKANIRNKLRRRLKDINKNLLEGNKSKSRDILMIILPGLEKKEYEELKDMVKKIFQKLKLIQ